MQSDKSHSVARDSVLGAIRGLLDSIMAKNIDGVMNRYVHDDRLLVFLEGPESKVEGWDEDFIREAWYALLDKVSFSELRLDDDVRAGACDTIGYVAATIRGRYGRVDQEPAQHVSLSARGTWILERAGADWLIVSEHVSFPVPDPYPTS